MPQIKIGTKVYIIGYNLFTFSNVKKYNLDPEVDRTAYDTYPNTSNYTFGLQIGF